MEASVQAPAPAATPKDRYPPQVGYIVGTEGCERFSYYGMTSILVLYLTRSLHFSDPNATAFYHLFTGVAFLAPLAGGWISDRFFGRYQTILWVSFGYVAGHAVLAFWEGIPGLIVGCLLIAIGAGGIKPCVSAFAADQFPPEKQYLLERMYGWFYFSINLGSIGGQFFVPKLLDWYRPSVAFAAPGVGMAVALIVYFLGRSLYVKPPPTGKNPHSFLKVSWTAARASVPAGRSKLDAVAAKYPADAVNGVRATLRILAVFAPIIIFWALFFQYGSSWLLQGEKMDLTVLGLTLNPAQVSTLNSLFVLALIPVMNVIYKRLEERGRPMSALRKMSIGLFVAGLSFIAPMVIQVALDRGGHPHVLWQVVQYFLISLAEVLVSVTGLEFAYTQAPPSMKSTIMGFWFLTIALGSFLTALVAYVDKFSPLGFFAFFALTMFVAAGIFWAIARWYRPVKFGGPAAA